MSASEGALRKEAKEVSQVFSGVVVSVGTGRGAGMVEEVGERTMVMDDESLYRDSKLSRLGFRRRWRMKYDRDEFK